jgi:hypothetical protein
VDSSRLFPGISYNPGDTLKTHISADRFNHPGRSVGPLIVSRWDTLEGFPLVEDLEEPGDAADRLELGGALRKFKDRCGPGRMDAPGR